MADIQPTGILARVSFYHEQGARLEVISQHAHLKELGVVPETYDSTVLFNIGTEIVLHDTRYSIINMGLVVMPRLNSSTVPEIDPVTYFTGTNEQLPNNLFIHVTLRPL